MSNMAEATLLLTEQTAEKQAQGEGGEGLACKGVRMDDGEGGFKDVSQNEYEEGKENDSPATVVAAAVTTSNDDISVGQGPKTPSDEEMRETSVTSSAEVQNQGQAQLTVDAEPGQGIAGMLVQNENEALRVEQQLASSQTMASQSQPTAPPASTASGPIRHAQTISSRQYLDRNIVPILLEGLGALTRDRPDDAIQYLAEFLIREKQRFINYRPYSND